MTCYYFGFPLEVDLLVMAFVSVSSIDSFGTCKKMGGRPPSFSWYSWAGAWQGQLLQVLQQEMAHVPFQEQ